MDGDLCRGFGDAVAGGGFGDGGAFEAGLSDEVGGAARHVAQDGFDVAAIGSVGAVIAGEDWRVVFERDGGADGVATDVVHEFVVGNREGLIAARSMNIGCVRLTERYSVSSPLTEQQKTQILRDVDQAIDEAAQTVDFTQAERLIGVAGTVTTVTANALKLNTYDSQVINATELSLEEISESALQLYSMSAQERAGLGFMHPGRIDVIGTGALIWARIVERLSEISGGKITGAIASEFDILDGLALSLTQTQPS